MPQNTTLFDDIGGLDGCRRLSAAFYARAPLDPVLRRFFPRPPHCAIESLAQFLAQILGGPPGYSAMRPWLSLTEAHARFKIGEDERAAWMENMTAAVDGLSLTPANRDTLLGFLRQASTSLVNHERPRWRVAGDWIDSKLHVNWSNQEKIDETIKYLREGNIDRALGAATDVYIHTDEDQAALANLLAEIGISRDAKAMSWACAIIDEDRSLLTELYYYGSILHHASSTTASTFVDSLLSLGADPNLRDKFGHTPLYSTCNGAGDVTIARALIAAGADVDAQDYVKRCAPLHMAARRGRVDVSAVLLDGGANVEVRDIHGQTPLRRAVNCGKVDVAHLLIDHGADVDAVDKHGVSPRQAAEKSGRVFHKLGPRDSSEPLV